MMTETAAKRDTQKLQRAIVDGLEDVKAQDIVVFNTEHLSALFERVVIASGSSNRQTKALAASVRDTVRKAGFPKPRVEGEENGEWIIVDCGQAVVHIMQPNIRQYYHLEDLWGDKPVRLKFGTDKPVQKPETKSTVKPVKSSSTAPASLKRSNAAKKGVMEAYPSKAQVKKDEAKKVAKKTASAVKPSSKVVVKPRVKAPAKAAAKTSAKPSGKSPVKSAPKKTASRKS